MRRELNKMPHRFLIENNVSLIKFRYFDFFKSFFFCLVGNETLCLNVAHFTNSHKTHGFYVN